MDSRNEQNTLYDDAHLVVAAIRILQHRKKTPPLVDEVAEFLGFSLEQTHFLCNQLSHREILEAVEGAYGPRLFVRNHTAIEEIPRQPSEAGFDDEIKKFQSERKMMDQKIESIKAKQAEKKKNLFAEMEKKLKSQMDKNKTNGE